MRSVASDLNSDEEQRYNFDFHIAGQYLAFATVDTPRFGPGASCHVTVINLASGQTTNLSTALCTNTGRNDLAVDRAGFVAWIVHHWARAGSNPIAGQSQLYGRDSNGRHLLDTGEPLDLGSLKFTGNTLHWTNNNSTRQATLQ